MRESFRIRILLNLIGITCSIVLSGCALQTRKAISNAESAVARNSQSPSNSGAELLPSKESKKEIVGDSGQLVLAPTAQSVATPTRDNFLNRALPKIGLIIGPGGMKSYAAIGVIQELAKARIPVSAIVGIEWGALIAGLYAEKSLANDAEWKALRLKESEWPSTNMIKGFRPKSVDEISEFISTVAGRDVLIDRFKIPFACPSQFKRDKVSLISKGMFSETLEKCIPYPPLYKSKSDWMAAPFAFEESAQWLKAQGVQLIIVVNTLGTSEVLTQDLAEEQLSASVLWSEIRHSLQKLRAPTVNWFININSNSVKLDEFNKGRAVIELGAKAAAELASRLSTQYGF